MPEWFGVRREPGKAFNRKGRKEKPASSQKRSRRSRKEVGAVNLLARKNIKVE
jgi:hypothetical protein